MDTYEYVTINASADRILLIASELGIRQVVLKDFETVLENSPDAVRASNSIIKDAGWQISEYLQGKRKQIDVPLDLPTLPPYRAEVLHSLQGIPYGETRTYAQVAYDTGRAKAFRAVGSACRLNPVPIIIPCHRVIPRSGTIGSYIGGTEFKALLLSIEHSHN